MPPIDGTSEKATLRATAEQRRREQPDKDRLSAVICDRFAGLAEYLAAETVMVYVGVRNEVRTRPFVAAALAAGRRLVVPYCVGRELHLFRLDGLEELEIGHFGIPEPAAGMRHLVPRRVAPAALDVVMVPGVAFDRRGGRIGHGKGYYDQLLARVRPDAFLAGLAFECQLFPTVPMEDHDVFLDAVITEKRQYPGLRRP